MINKITLEEGYKPSDNEKYMCGRHLEYFRKKLIAWKEELLEESRETLNHMKEENWKKPEECDLAALTAESTVELRTRDRGRKLIDKIDTALKNIESALEGKNLKAYGYCEVTGEPIGLRRLEARPVATLSLEEQEKCEEVEKQYAN